MTNTASPKITLVTLDSLGFMEVTLTWANGGVYPGKTL